MQTNAGPGDTPEWKTKLAAMTPFQRTRFAVALGTTERTVHNWITDKTHPGEATVERITKQLGRQK